MSAAHIGSTIQIKGEVFAEEPLTIAGTVVGTIDVSGHPLTVTDGAMIEADIVARTIVVAGRVSGSVTADERMVVQKTASIEGEATAPAMILEDGATVHGRLEIAGRRAPLALAS
jgi:cytoskeletal protein CcmA (bactofilin family)